MNGHELLEHLAAGSELPDNSAVQFHFVNLAAVLHRGGARRVGTVKVLVFARGNADGPGRAHIDVGGFEVAVVVKYVESLVRTVADVDVASVVHLDRVDVFKLTGAAAA